MALNKTKGNMYGFITHTWNPLKGKCFYDCSYCYIKKMMQKFNNPQKPPQLYKSELKTNLGTGNFIFIGSGIDMFAPDIHDDDITQVFNHCNKYPDNRYLFQTKNPSRLIDFQDYFPKKYYLCTTIESNRLYSKITLRTPQPYERIKYIHDLKQLNHTTIITIEPIMQFDINTFYSLLISANPDFIYIGADSKNCGLPEPGKDKIKELIDALRYFGLNVKIKSNLWRLIG